MKEDILQKEITTSELAVMMMNGFDRLEKSLNERFMKIDERFDEVYRRFDEVEKRFVKVDGRFDILEEKFDRRMSVAEDNIFVIKNVIEKDLHVKVRF